MRIALVHAARGTGRTSPNPMVGCVIADGEGVIVGTGFHVRAGEPHAEIHALRAAGPRARGATLYCTLEPCSHHGRTGPCVVPITEAGVRRVVVATRDPSPQVAGRGLAFLRERGVEVCTGSRRDEALRLNRAFFTAVTLGRPHVTLKVATSVDARVAAASGARTSLTSAPAARRVQLMRAALDAIAVGSGTVLADDPLLTARDVHRERPFLRVLFDRRLRISPAARVFATLGAGPVWIATTAAAAGGAPDRAAALRDAGAEIVVTEGGTLAEVLAVLGARQVRSLLLEGGPAIHTAAWRDQVVDEVAVFVTPAVLGATGVPWAMPPGFATTALRNPRVAPLGPDVLIEGDVHWTD